jgi:cell wall-associated NlpC family hydrolase
MSRSESARAPKLAPRIRSARLAGPSLALDPRINACRPDLADVSLADRVVASAYAEPKLAACTVERVMLRGKASADAVAVSELVQGEGFAVIERGGLWSWGYAVADDYVGYVPTTTLGPPLVGDTTTVSAPLALVFGEPDIKSPVRKSLPMGARIVVTGADDKFAALAGGGYVHRRHLGGVPADHVEAARLFLATPYLWGGRTAYGLDCSGLVQIALQATGLACPRDADQQRALGREIDPADRRRGDLVFFPGHVGILVDADTLLHANAFWMSTVIEPLGYVVARGSEMQAIRRV